MELMWLLIVGLFFGAWFVLDGFTVGVGLTMRMVTGPGTPRRAALTAVGPFLLANEVWLVATAGLMAASYPALESGVMPGLYPVITALLVSWVVRDAGFWFRSRRESRSWQRFWEGALTAGSLGLALTAGITLGNLLGGLPSAPEGAGVLDPLALACGVLVTGVFALHGAVFLSLRLPAEQAPAAAALAARLSWPVAALGAVVVALAFVLGDLARPWPALAVALAGLAAVVLAGRFLAGRRYGRAFACTGLAALLPVLAVGFGQAPELRDGAATQTSLEQLATLALPVIPLLLLSQVWMWWIFRHRVGRDSVAFF
ncbi:cytochrome d ubiquinol oxidase subunit II [Thermomonospora amylolytica]|uniref:cytochrome d ubiquinol oxidase subunit II n=1 Tax=Thermomonospora amylolytica TaxID=1411117 RepID=UPI000E6C1E52|nr:cytochrome d ubiquinol oxidase subunit II [Thermomonospora amylolytica]